MFGYVKIFRPELKVREYDIYKAVYCSLCNTLGKRYGIAARMTLSYDFTFLALFLMALRDEDIAFKQGRCPFHPLKKRPLCHCEEAIALEYAADVAMLLVYHKLQDTIDDEHFLKRVSARFLRILYTRDYRLAVARRPKEAEAAKRYMQQQRAVESSQHSGVDAAAEPTASFLSKLAVGCLPNTEDTEIISRFAYCLGRFIYLADAADDAESDLKNGNFNPYNTTDARLSSDQKEYAAQSLHACVAVCAEVYDDLPIKRFDGILRNVIFHGLPHVISTITTQKQEEIADEQSL